MKKNSIFFALAICCAKLNAQTNPAITGWMQNTTGIMASHYEAPGTTPVSNNIEANVQTVQYSNDWVYISTHGLPAYTTGPFQDGNPSSAEDQDAIFKIPLNPVENPNAYTNTNMGNIGIFINGVALFDYADGVSWNNNNSSLGGGPIPGPQGDGIWKRDAIKAEREGFDCAKGHPAMGNYHHHQNPSAFDLDLIVISDVCDLYSADGLYIMDASQHSPLLGFAYDGFPIYGAYSYAHPDGSGGIVRMKSSYVIRDITTRTTYADGTNVTDGPPISDTYPLGYFREDYEFNATLAIGDDYLDEHNGRICETPEYPDGIYCYFTTVDENWNSAYPYVVGPTFYGTKTATKLTVDISENVTTYTPSNNVAQISAEDIQLTIFPNPASDMIAIQSGSLNLRNWDVSLFDLQGKLRQKTRLNQGSTMAYFDARTLYAGEYMIQLSNGKQQVTKKVVIQK